MTTITARAIHRRLVREGKIMRIGSKPPRTGTQTNMIDEPSPTKGPYPRWRSRHGKRANT